LKNGVIFAGKRKTQDKFIKDNQNLERAEALKFLENDYYDVDLITNGPFKQKAATQIGCSFSIQIKTKFI